MTDRDQRAEKLLQDQKVLFSQREPNKENARAAIQAALLAFIGVREIGKTNTGYWVDIFHKAVGLKPGFPWCLMLIQYVYKLAPSWLGLPDLIPFNTAGTLSYGNWAKKNGLTVTSFADVKESDTLVWHNGKGSDKGHVGAVTSIVEVAPGIWSLQTVEGNTSDKNGTGDYRDGGNIAEKMYTYSDSDIGKVSSKRYLFCIVSFDKLYQEVVK